MGQDKKHEIFKAIFFLAYYDLYKQHEEPTNHRSKNPLYFQGKSLPTAAKLQR